VFVRTLDRKWIAQRLEYLSERKWMRTANVHAFRAQLAFAHSWSIDGALPIAAVERTRGNLDFEMFAAGRDHAVGADHET
jgi:hypothetical protein